MQPVLPSLDLGSARNLSELNNQLAQCTQSVGSIEVSWGSVVVHTKNGDISENTIIEVANRIRSRLPSDPVQNQKFYNIINEIDQAGVKKITGLFSGIKHLIKQFFDWWNDRTKKVELFHTPEMRHGQNVGGSTLPPSSAAARRLTSSQAPAPTATAPVSPQAPTTTAAASVSPTSVSAPNLRSTLDDVRAALISFSRAYDLNPSPSRKELAQYLIQLSKIYNDMNKFGNELDGSIVGLFGSSLGLTIFDSNNSYTRIYPNDARTASQDLKIFADIPNRNVTYFKAQDSKQINGYFQSLIKFLDPQQATAAAPASSQASAPSAAASVLLIPASEEERKEFNEICDNLRSIKFNSSRETFQKDLNQLFEISQTLNRLKLADKQVDFVDIMDEFRNALDSTIKKSESYISAPGSKAAIRGLKDFITGLEGQNILGSRAYFPAKHAELEENLKGLLDSLPPPPVASLAPASQQATAAAPASSQAHGPSPVASFSPTSVPTSSSQPEDITQTLYSIQSNAANVSRNKLKEYVETLRDICPGIKSMKGNARKSAISERDEEIIDHFYIALYATISAIERAPFGKKLDRKVSTAIDTLRRLEDIQAPNVIDPAFDQLIAFLGEKQQT